LASQSPLLKGASFDLIPYSVDQRVFYPRKQRKYLPTWNGRTILFLSSFLNDERKGYSYFEAAISQVIETNASMDIRVVAVGNGHVSDKLKRCCSVIETGPILDRNVLAELYSGADIFVMPSIQDNLPNTVLESMACGTPVVCFDIGGMPDMIVHRDCGYVARAKDPQDLAAGILELLEDPERLERMGNRALRRIDAYFSEKAQVEKHIALYQAILAGND
jgi:glycosyltransferase involved in cell wall biosynthesis